MMRPWLGFLGVLAVAVVVHACHDGRAQSPVTANTLRDALTQLGPGDADLVPLTVSFDHLDALHGGLQLTIHGDGKIEQRALRTTVREPKDNVAPHDVRVLVDTLVKHEVWIQRVEDRTAVPDESRATLRTCYREDCVEIWEWYNDLEKNARIAEVLRSMQTVARRAAAPETWTLTIQTSGGFTGRGNGGITASSDGNVTTGGFGTPSCRQQLPPADLEPLSRAIAEAEPATWTSSYVRPDNPDGCCDQFRYTLALELQPAGGPPTKYATFWYSEMSNGLPVDVRRVFDTAWKTKAEAAAKCNQR